MGLPGLNRTQADKRYGQLIYNSVPLTRILRWHDATVSLAALADNAAVTRFPDLSSFGQDLQQFTTGQIPTKQTDAGAACIQIATGQGMNSSVEDTSIYPQPLTMFAVIKGDPTLAQNTLVYGGNATGGRARISTNGSSFGADGVAGGTLNGEGPQLNDNAWHIVTAVYDLGQCRIYVDGWLTGFAAAQTHGTEGLKSPSLGYSQASTNQFIGRIKETMAIDGRLNADQVQKLNVALGAKHGITVATRPHAASLLAEDVTLGSGQGVRVYTPAKLATPTTLVLFCHKQGGSQFVQPGNFEMILAKTANNAGWIFAASAMHGSDSWGNASAQSDLLDLYNLINGRSAISKVILIGESMGGVGSALVVSAGTVPNVVGVYDIDAALSLSAMYGGGTYESSINTGFGITQGTLSSAMASTGLTSIPTTASFPTIGTQLLIGNGTANAEVVTTKAASTGTAVAVTATTKTHASGDHVSDYPTKTSGFDPLLQSANSYSGVRWRFLASSADVAVVKTSNTDAFRTLLGTATTPPAEYALVTHAGGHLAASAFQPADLTAFALRCGAGALA